MEYEATIEVHAAASLTDAHLLRIFLEQSGIPASVVGPLNQGAHAGFPAELESIPTVRVAISDKARALYAVREWEQCHREARTVVQPPRVPSRWRGPARALAVFAADFVAQLFCGFGAALLGLGMGGAWLVSMVGGLITTVSAVRFCFGADALERIGLVEAGWRANARAVLVGLGLVLVWSVAYAWLIPADWGTPGHPIFDLALESRQGFIISAIIAVVLAPVVEELLFRGAMLHGFRRRWSVRTSVGLMALIFAAIHIDLGDPYWPGVAYTGVIAVVFAMLRLRTGSLVPAMIAHATYNAAGLLELVL